ncbi:hypothetical protein D3C78_649040 [compost metagenome]
MAIRLIAARIGFAIIRRPSHTTLFPAPLMALLIRPNAPPPLIPRMENCRRISASGPSNAATASMTVPSTTASAANAAPTFSRPPASRGFSSTQRRNVPVTSFTVFIMDSSGSRSVSPRLLKAFCAPVLTSNHCADRESLLISDSFCMEPFASPPDVSLSWRCSSGRLLASFAASSPNSLPKSMVMADRRLSCGSRLTFSSTRWMVPMASVVICFSI